MLKTLTRAPYANVRRAGQFLKPIDELTNAIVAVTAVTKVGDLYFYLKITRAVDVRG